MNAVATIRLIEADAGLPSNVQEGYPSDPLKPFVSGCAAPYLFKRRHSIPVLVTPVRCKVSVAVTTLAKSRLGVAHHITSAASVVESGRVRFAARWACGGAAQTAVLIADASSFRTCRACEDKLDPQPVVYRCFDSAGNLLYIGSTFQRNQRFRSHELTSQWWAQAADIKLEKFQSIAEARFAEAKAIFAEKPPHNHIGRDVE